MRASPAGIYGKDLARIHHEGFGSFARGAAPGLLRWLREAGLSSGTVVDLGCGSGIWLARLLRAGYRGVGVDTSAAFLRLARRNAPGARLLRASAGRCALPSCDAVTAMGEVLGYRPAGGRGAPALEEAVRSSASALRRGGLLVFDLLVAGRGRPLRYAASKTGRGWSLTVDVNEDPRRGVVLRTIRTAVTTGRGIRRSAESHVIDVFERHEVERLLRDAGFTVRVSRSYGGFRLPPRRLAFRARKR